MPNTGKIDRLRLLAVLMVVIGIVYFYFNVFAPRLIPDLFKLGTPRRPVTILILGTDITFDKVTGEPIDSADGRTDSIVLARIDPARYKINLLSLPRDSFVPIPGYAQNKINAANVFGGVELIKKTVEELTGRQVDYYIKVNPYAITRLVNLVGGVALYIDKDMYYVDRAQNLNINLKQGWKKLSGKEAQDYIRFRHDALGDISRVERQQIFLQQLFLTLARPANLLKAPLVVEIMIKYIKTDLSLKQLIRLANFARMLSPKDVVTLTAPGTSGQSDYAGSIWLLDKPALEKILSDHF